MSLSEQEFGVEQPSSGSLPAPVAELEARVVEEMVAAWERGERPRAEMFLDQNPPLRAETEAAVRIIYEEVCLRQEAGEEVNPAEVLGRFPQWRAQLQILLDCHHLVQSLPGEPVFPEVGETLDGLHLLAELGRGAQGRVFLATQPTLADRPVVLKVTSGEGQEHLSLARLQHTHIAPLFWAQDYPERNLRVLCMPYLGGASLAHVLKQLRACPPEQRTGTLLLDALDRAAARNERGVRVSTVGPVRQLLARASYVQALCWMGAALADALQYAHERGLVHLDLKPSNVLLAADGQALLLDFHLAREPLLPGKRGSEWFGGTPDYMSPEQRLALDALRQGQPVTTTVDAHSDIYSLGLLLYEALGGRVPEGGLKDGGLRLDRCNPEVSTGLADVIHKCLDANPTRRYASAAALALDLRHHLRNERLVGVANRSWRERWQKWRRRKPQGLKLLVLWFLLLGGAVGGAAAAWGINQKHRQKGLTSLEKAPPIRRGAFALRAKGGDPQDSARELTRALDILSAGREEARHTWPEDEDLIRRLDREIQITRRAWASAQLQDLVHKLGFLYVAEVLPAEARTLEHQGQELWQRRAQLLDGVGGDLEPAIEQQLRADLLDLALLEAVVHVRLASAAEKQKARTEALHLLDEAEQTFGASSVLDQERRILAAGGKRIANAGSLMAQRVPETAWEHYALGRSLLQAGALDAAEAELQRACDQEPEHFWPTFYLGVCAYRKGDYPGAEENFNRCIGKDAHSGPCYYNLARAQEAAGRGLVKVIHNYTLALRWSPDLVEAYHNRGLCYYRQGKYAAALADLKETLARGLRTAAVYYNLALVHYQLHDSSGAGNYVRQALRLNPTYREALRLQEKLAEERKARANQR